MSNAEGVLFGEVVGVLILFSGLETLIPILVFLVGNLFFFASSLKPIFSWLRVFEIGER